MKSRPVRLPDRGRVPVLSVVLPVLNEGQDIGRVLGEIFRQREPLGGYEVLVVDGGSTDDTRQIVQDLAGTHPNLRLFENPGKLSSSGRNVGARAARGTYVLYLDGHCSIPRDDYFVRVLDLFQTSGAACLCRPQYLDALADSKWAAAIAKARHSRLGHNYRSDIFGGGPGFTDPRSAGAAYRRDCIEHLGGYDERFDACEDVEFNHRVAEAGFSAYRHPDLRIDYRPRASLRGLFRQMFRYGRGRARLMARHHLVPWPLVGITGLLVLAAIVLLVAGPKVSIFMVGVPIAAWILSILAESLRLNRGAPTPAARTSLAFLTLYVGLLAGFWRGIPEARSYHAPPYPPAPSGRVGRVP